MRAAEESGGSGAEELRGGPAAAALRAGPVGEAIRRHRLIVVLRRIEPLGRLVALVDELADSGARVFEITFDAPSATDDVAAVREHLADRADGPFMVGAGTLVGRDRLEAALGSGTDFGVAPVLDVGLVREAVSAGLPFVAGAFTPTEIVTAWSAGATFVKLFPASAVGPSFVREMRGPLPEVGLIPTGGVDGSNAAEFLRAGAVAVGIGSALTKSDPASRRALVAAIANEKG
ncbi:MAG: bifunctional 4-hydroxy-2-oxoglutarate aldolase/2-dehydro-3-deoxy-phosphogluconate aldolase [Acidobacteriota bacterium]|nr:bifunctional 4-hydroxy-2-oxoglutarate aldolase/2-dehydro-3-deoxy-phosphogluconate aldolase [Acidobacteriota bacterium]